MRYDQDTEKYKLDPYITPAPSIKEVPGQWRLTIAFTVGFLILFAMVVSRVTGGEHPLCSYFAELAKETGVEVAEWIGYPQGWRDYPQEWDYETFTPLVGESGILTRAKGNKRWLFAFRTLEEDNGNHNFCEHVLIVLDGP